MFLLPTLFLFVFLIFETAKISRIKIRHQFAVDAAAFVEMTNYSDFLNRSAYVNGAFPMRIFWEGFHDTELDCMGRDPCPGKKSLAELLYEDGVYPRSASTPDPTSFSGDQGSWDIEYHENRRQMNEEDPDVGSPDCRVSGGGSGGHSVAGPGGSSVADCAVIVSMNTAKYWNINWEDANQIYKLYVQIYQLLGSVESAQYAVLKRLAGQHNFLTKSYWLNTGGDQALRETAGLVSSFDHNASGFLSSVNFHCVQKVLFHGNQLVHSWGQPYQIWSSDPPPDMPHTIDDCRSGNLFQVVTVDKRTLQSMSDPNSGEYPGWPVEVQYALDPESPNTYKNYFNVDLQSLMGRADNGPRVHATVSVGGFGAKPAVWKEGLRGAKGPTPKFQVRLYP